MCKHVASSSCKPLEISYKSCFQENNTQVSFFIKMSGSSYLLSRYGNKWSRISHKFEGRGGNRAHLTCFSCHSSCVCVATQHLSGPWDSVYNRRSLTPSLAGETDPPSPLFKKEQPQSCRNGLSFFPPQPSALQHSLLLSHQLLVVDVLFTLLQPRTCLLLKRRRRWRSL